MRLLTLCLILALPLPTVTQSRRAAPVHRTKRHKRVQSIRYPKPPLVVAVPDVVQSYTMAEWEREERIRRALCLLVAALR